MCMRANEKDACELKASVAALDERVGKVEGRIDKIESSLSIGFTQVNEAVSNLANQFGERMNLIEKKVVDEKAKHDERVDLNRTKWHDTLRKVTLLVTYAILTSALIAVGINVASQFFPLAK